MTLTPRIRVVTLGLEPDVLADLGRELGPQYSVTTTCSPVEAMTALVEAPTRSAALTEVALDSVGGDRRGLAFLRVARFRAPRCARIVVTRQDVMLDDSSAQDVDAIFTVPWADGTLGRYLALWSSADDDAQVPI